MLINEESVKNRWLTSIHTVYINYNENTYINSCFSHGAVSLIPITFFLTIIPGYTTDTGCLQIEMMF